MFLANGSVLTAEKALPLGGAAHAVQFYDSDDFLAGVVSEFIARGLSMGEPAIVIATEAHRDAFTSGLSSRGIDVDAARAAGELILLDGRETLDRFMIGATPDRELFMTVVGAVVDAAGRGERRICAYGEMVDLLWRDGNREGAIALEEHWNELGKLYTFSLLCAYPLENFDNDAHRADFERVCGTHSHVIPAETDPSTLARDIAVLQQRARSLETEIEHRAVLEKALREALSAQETAERELSRTNEDNAFLLEATTALNQSLDYDERLHDVTRLVLPRVADWAALDMAREGGGIERKSVAHLAGIAEDAAGSVWHQVLNVLRTGEPELAAAGRHHVVIVPLMLSGRPFGALTLARSAAQPYSPRDIALAVEYALRASMAIENARLYRLAQNANRVKDQFLATLSHELRTPLTAILGWARMLTVGGLDAETIRVACSTIDRAAQTQASLIDDLLDLSKIVTGKLVLKSEPVDLATVIDGAVETLHLAAETKGIRLEVAAPRHAIVSGDATRLQQIVWNLVSNAVKFSERGSAVCIAVQQTRDLARIVVRDEGRGIDAEFLPHVFDAFRQADGGTTRDHGGLGLGLAIVKYLAELHGGSVSVISSGRDRGSTFTVTLPLAVQRAIKPEPAPDELIDLGGTIGLVVDDDADTRTLIALILQHSGASVVVAESADEASEAIRTKSFDVVVTDIAMPERDGFTFLSMLRANDDTRHLPVIALTASAGVEWEKRVTASGFDAYVRKPIDPMQFVRVVADTLRVARMR